MIYQSKKNPDVTAKIVKKPNEATVILEYLTGDDKGKNITITTNTLQRYWRKVEEEEKSAAEILNVDMEEVNKPYAPEVTPHYIPKPESVKEYEEKKKRIKCEFAVPATYDEFADILASKNVKVKSVNKGYIALGDVSKLKLLSSGIGILASTQLGEALASRGLQSRACIEQGTPFRFDIKTEDAYNTMYDVLAKLYVQEG